MLLWVSYLSEIRYSTLFSPLGEECTLAGVSFRYLATTTLVSSRATSLRIDNVSCDTRIVSVLIGGHISSVRAAS